MHIVQYGVGTFILFICSYLTELLKYKYCLTQVYVLRLVYTCLG